MSTEWPGTESRVKETGFAPEAPASHPIRRGVLSQMGRGVLFVWKWAAGAALTQSILGGLVVLGWTMRVMQRSVLKSWWKQSSARAGGINFTSWIESVAPAHDHRHWPNWLLRQNYLARPGHEESERRDTRRLSRLATGLLSSLWRNLKLGVQGAFNVWVFTMPGCILWLFSWYDGWNNSFNKGYEQAPVGPLLGVAGIVLFIAAMLYVPMAHARQAATGEWRSFYQFRLVWGLIRRRWTSCLLLAAGFSLLSIPITVMKTAPYFLAMGNSPIPDFTPEQALQYLKAYFFWCGFGFLAAWLVLRCWLARLYARALLKGLQQGEVSVSDLGAWERRELNRLELIQIYPPRSRHVLVEVAAGTSAGLWRFAMIAATCLVWFTFVAQIYIAEFLMYHPVHGWLNQPLVQLPWFRYLPPHLQENPFAELLGAVVVVGVLFGGAAVWRRMGNFLRSSRRRKSAAAPNGDTQWKFGQ